jgi:hypothetical protein
MSEIAATDSSANHRQLLRHRARPAWGLAIHAGEIDGQQAFQFEDGTMRRIAESHVGLLEPVEVGFEVEQAALSRLNELAGLTLARDAAAEGETLLTFDDQVAIFQHQFKGGFAGSGWQKKQRGAGTKRALKRHRDPAIARARELLSESAIAELLAGMRHDEVVRRAVEVLHESSLVEARPIEALRRLPRDCIRPFAEALRDVLYGEGRYELRLLQLLQALRSGGETSWALATALPALVQPERHVCVRPSTFREQARWMAPHLVLEKQADSRQYLVLLGMAKNVADKLTERDLAPRDLLDVYDFMWFTLRPSAKRMLDEAAPAESAVVPAAPASHAAA